MLFSTRWQALNFGTGVLSAEEGMVSMEGNRH